MSDVTQIKRRKLITSIQILISNEYIKLKTPVDLEKKKGAKVECEFLNNAESIIFDLLTAKSTYLQVKYSGFTEEEIEQYEVLAARMRENVQRALK